MAVIQVNENNFKEVSAKGKVLVTFSASWCGPCKMLAPVLDEVSEDMADLKVIKVDVDESPNLAREFDVMGVPSTFYIQDGEVFDKLMGFAPKERLVDWIEGQ